MIAEKASDMIKADWGFYQDSLHQVDKKTFIILRLTLKRNDCKCDKFLNRNVHKSFCKDTLVNFYRMTFKRLIDSIFKNPNRRANRLGFPLEFLKLK